MKKKKSFFFYKISVGRTTRSRKVRESGTAAVRRFDGIPSTTPDVSAGRLEPERFETPAQSNFSEVRVWTSDRVAVLIRRTRILCTSWIILFLIARVFSSYSGNTFELVLLIGRTRNETIDFRLLYKSCKLSYMPFFYLSIESMNYK